jgi:chaperonin GroES
MTDQLRPLFDRLLIKDLPQEQMRRSGLVIPEDQEATWRGPLEGIVLAAGPGLDWWSGNGVEMPVSVGDHVMFLPRSGVIVEINEEALRVCRVGELLGIMERAQAVSCTCTVREVNQPCPIHGFSDEGLRRE